MIDAVTTIIGSDFADNGTTRDGGGIALLFTGLPSVNNSCITDNDRVDTSGLPLSSNGLFAGQGTTDATDNWWGASNGPSGPGLSGSGDFVYESNISVNPFQTASIPCGPQPPICPAGGTQSAFAAQNSDCIPNLSVQIETNTSFPLEEEDVIITVALTNTGLAPAQNVEITVDLSADLTVLSTNGDGTYSNGVWSLSVLDAENTATLTIEISTIGASLGNALDNTATITAYSPSNATIAQGACEIELIPALCVGTINGTLDVNIRSERRTKDPNGLDVSNFVSVLSPNTEVPVIDYDVHEHINQSVSRTTREDDIEVNYGWYNIVLPEDTIDPNRSGWIVYHRLDECEELSEPLAFDTQIVGTDDDVPLPLPTIPPMNSNIRCAIGIENDLARNDCAAQVYYAFYNELPTNSRTLTELLASIVPIELRGVPTGSVDIDVVNGTYVNNWRRSCGGGCDGNELVEWLGSKQGWFGLGLADFNIIDVSGLVSDAQNQQNQDVVDGQLSQPYTTPGGDIPVDRGNWWFGVFGGIPLWIISVHMSTKYSF